MADDGVDLNELAAFPEEEEEAKPTQKVAIAKKADTHTTIHTSGFREFLLKPELLRAISECGFEHPSEVQHACIPQAVMGTDVICQAKSGMGKTAVFTLAVLQRLDPSEKKVMALILCHTRELAYQIKHEFDRFSKYLSAIKSEVFYGGAPIAQHRQRLAQDPPHIVIGTPGRINQLAREKNLNLQGVKYFILDECDKMLETLDMRKDVQEIFKQTPHEKQVMMFSATLAEDIKPVCKRFMHNPLEIYIAAEKITLHGLVQYYVQLKEDQKNRKLVDLLDALQFNQVIIFVKSVPRADVLNKLLQECKFPSAVHHGRLTQDDRIATYKKFKEFGIRILVSTNVFGRGVDFERVNVVINYDMAEDIDTYLHRVGRAGRFGTKGLAISFISTDEDSQVLNSVQEKFVVNIPQLPDEIDAATYMNA